MSIRPNSDRYRELLMEFPPRSPKVQAKLSIISEADLLATQTVVG